MTQVETLFDMPAQAKTRRRAAVTFEGGLDAPFHRWFRLTPSFSPDLVRDWLADHGVRPGMRVLEPFSGAGTTAIVCKTMGIDAIGMEINPFLAFVGQTCLDWTPEAPAIRAGARDVISRATAAVAAGSTDPEQFAADLGTDLPTIHNVHRWWRADVLCQLVALRHYISLQPEVIRNHLRLAMAQIVYSTANITLGRLQVAFVDRSQHRIEVFEEFVVVSEQIAKDLELVADQPMVDARIMHADSTAPGELDNDSIDAIFTSPPYPNRYSYVWNTRPHLYLLEFFTKPRDATDLDLKTIGGTWGNATTSLQKGILEPREAVEASAGEVIARLHNESTLMGNYVTKYFNALDTQIEALTPKLRAGAPVGYVVGNSESKGIMIETHDILADLFARNGYTGIDQEVLRKRNSGAGLNEVTVTAHAPN